jgi:hypothetical protein
VIHTKPMNTRRNVDSTVSDLVPPLLSHSLACVSLSLGPPMYADMSSAFHVPALFVHELFCTDPFKSPAVVECQQVLSNALHTGRAVTCSVTSFLDISLVAALLLSVSLLKTLN